MWLILSTPTAGRLIERHDRFPRFGHTHADTWLHAFTTLAAEGRVDRRRLLDAVLSGLLDDRAAVDRPFHLRLHDALAPAPAELAERQSRYAGLLSSPHGPSARLGVDALATLTKERLLDLDGLLSASPAPLTGSGRAVAVATLNLLGAVARQLPDSNGAVAAAAATALEHADATVQERCLKLLGTLVPDSARRDELVALHAEALARASSSGPRHHTSVAVGRPTRDKGLDRRPVACTGRPLASAAELVELLQQLMVRADDPLDVERALDGVVRFAPSGPEEGRALRFDSRLPDRTSACT